MADAQNGVKEDVSVKEEEAVVEEPVPVKEAVDGGVVQKVEVVEESVEVVGVEEPVTVLVEEGLAAEVEEKEVAVESEVVTEEVASEMAPIPVEDGEGVAVLDPVASEESSETAYVVAKETEEASLSTTPEVPSVAVGQEEIPESTGNPVPISVSARSPTSWRGCCGLLDVLGRS
ncbi:hypothetical protein MLD38_009218 [Melastoma candidum]|uniref:Uncharacterized protein n=1 Tax=Melastoma candidum TaxID=119954 RepID=A0ACB9S163_9MYRT|nr:hypothetical protein MLD38_009218 [Melastoma candidum]